MQIIKNPKEYEAFYSYDHFKYLTPDKYPTEYPCICQYIKHGGGLGGEYVEHKITYCPEWADWNSWVKGFEMGNVQYTEF